MTHYNGDSSWEGGHKWVSSVDGFSWEFHDKPPLWGVRSTERWMNGAPVVPTNPMKEVAARLQRQPLQPQKILMSEQTYKSLVKP